MKFENGYVAPRDLSTRYTSMSASYTLDYKLTRRVLPVVVDSYSYALIGSKGPAAFSNNLYARNRLLKYFKDSKIYKALVFNLRIPGPRWLLYTNE